jgi:4-diphosphocytidyl-2-C-methyl-D-erythritol kinase
LHITPTDESAIVRDTPLEGIPEADDLTLRAALRLQRATGCRRGARIAVEKRIPMGGGLGGGSSDAATVLLALNHLWGCGLGRADLMALGLDLGADVPFFLFGEAAWVEGIGEALRPLPILPAWYLVVHPRVLVPTAAIFGDAHLTRDTDAATMRDFVSGARPFRNDLQPVAVRRFPAVGEALQQLGGGARMTGSGSCVFVRQDSRQAAERVAAQLARDTVYRVAQGLACHPHHDLLSAVHP